jgi:hypothetical protein
MEPSGFFNFWREVNGGSKLMEPLGGVFHMRFEIPCVLKLSPHRQEALPGRQESGLS